MIQSIIILNVLVLMNPVLSQTTHALIGNYSEFNQEFCGKTRKSDDFDSSCFIWHRDVVPKMSDARNVTAGEAPWTVLIMIQSSMTYKYCTGSLINELWVLTAAHCLDIERLKIYTGFDYQLNTFKKPTFHLAKNMYKHPHFNYKTYENDIALIKLRSAIPVRHNKGDGYFKENTICLPEKDNHNTRKEYAYEAGWGKTEEMGLGLQMGYRVLNPWSYEDVKIKHYSPDGYYRTCLGDSGGPLWQNSNGRAVLIGVQSTHWLRGTVDRYNCPLNENFAQAESVSMYIDWIRDTVDKNS